MGEARINRREVLIAGAAAGAALVLPRSAWSAGSASTDGWPGWACSGVANLRRDGSAFVLEAGSDVFPCDPRPVAFAIDKRFLDGAISATFQATGAGSGLVLRRTGARSYLAAILDDEQHALVIVRRTPDGAEELARTEWTGSKDLRFEAAGTELTATSGVLTVTATDPAPVAGDPGVLATARTLFPSSGPAALPALGNVHLLPYGVQEGEAFMQTDVGQEVLAQIRERSTAVLTSISIEPVGSAQVTPATVVAATNGMPFRLGGQLRVASDLPARVEFEFAHNSKFRRSRVLRAGSTNEYDGAFAQLRDLPPGARVHWRARLHRRGQLTVGPARSFKVLPPPRSDAPAKVVVAACASQFGPIFDVLRARQPDAFVWQGDLNYPDTIGPLAQTFSGYAGIWRDFLLNPRMAPMLQEGMFAPQRDDHDYGVQDANSTTLVPWALHPWESLMNSRLYYRFPAGHAEFWVLDQRRFKSRPDLPDTVDKTLLGADQRAWLLRTLASSQAAFKVICSPCTVAGVGGNDRDGDWAKGFQAERDLVLAHIKANVSGTTLFITGDTHWTMVYDDGKLFEARPCPLGIPTPNDITLTNPNEASNARSRPGVLYADQQYSHFGMIELEGPQLDLSLVREDGVVAFKRRFEAH